MTIKRILKIALLSLLVAVVPAIFIFFSSLWTVFVKAEKEYREDALILLARDVWFARNRQFVVASLARTEGFYAGVMPVIGVADPGPPAPLPLTIRFPACADPEVIEDQRTLRLALAAGYPYSFRRQDIEDAGNLRLAEKLGVTHLALLRSCLIATPFAEPCGTWFERQSVGDEEIVNVLKEKNQLQISDNRLCWPQSELVGPDMEEQSGSG
ncbi:hypothetical protein K3175_08855 [Qipengyuania sp. GH1]|uniref:hypothetical protein n=1 Tax=Qipengyuania aestuarii TaxID=2867241 RepID=UPI001C888B7B|nr:hypothetical protein [Qipengyuania aestuarii]MBX7535770.1 hypothetical protein [Qipengyuania aestuarii]